MPIIQITEIKCCYYNVGYYKNTSNCNYFHPVLDCDNNCASTKCVEKHRKDCTNGATVTTISNSNTINDGIVRKKIQSNE